MPAMQFFYDYECPYSKRIYAPLVELLKQHPGICVEYRPVEAHPRPENHPPHTDLCVQAYYIALELGADMAAFHQRMFQCVSAERRNVEIPEVLGGIVEGLVDQAEFLAILKSGKYEKMVTENDDLAYEKSGVWATPAFRLNGKRLDAVEGVGLTVEQIKEFLEQA
ncbi:MAG: DsbA family protein [Christensenellaceae bacterium]|nr:DsbA family protein [Christensenellaceae bacterium]